MTALGGARIIEALSHRPSIESVAPSVKLGMASTPNDPDYGQQWALSQIGWDQAYGVISVTGSVGVTM